MSAEPDASRKLLYQPETLIAFVTVWLMLTGNLAYWGVISDAALTLSANSPLYFLQVGAVTFGLSWLLLLLVAVGPLTRPLLALVLIGTAAVGYFAFHYGVLFDENMLVNVVETNVAESMELMAPALIATVIFTGIVPAAMLFRFPLAPRRWKFAVGARSLALVLALSIVAGGIFADQKTIFSLARNHRDIRHMLSPLNLYSAVWGYTGDQLQVEPAFEQLATDASHLEQSDRPLVHVLVIGETARAANFSLGGYARATNPELANLPVIYFPSASSCGTATSASLPCMFAVQDQAHFDRQLSKRQDNLLDIAARAGYDVYWRDNGNSCKSICARVNSRDLRDSEIASLCAAGECYDEILIHELALLLPAIKKDTLIVLHQLGSHGPAYFRRYPESFRVFTPDCRSIDLGDCSDPEIVNAYDNTIVYTDHVLAAAIELLAAHSDRLDTSLLYVSDHGESLGEHGLYLHGMPYAIAPAEQTHVPMLAWLSPGLRTRRGMADVCGVAQPRGVVSHDNLFFTELGLLEIDTALYVAEQDVFADYCQPRNFAKETI